MPFQITARTILQLGAELISSDAIAFYELIKNAFDAGSAKVEVRVVIRLESKLCQELLESCDDIEKEVSKKKLRDVIDQALYALNTSAPEADVLKQGLDAAETLAEVRSLLGEANYIQFTDSGEGMSLDELESIYLVIGTRSRREQRQERRQSEKSDEGEAQTRRPILGEKGLGRLSVMRLGDGLRVQTTKAGETHFNLLEIDWSSFSHDSSALLGSIAVAPVLGEEKPDAAFSGTTIRISRLHANWNLDKIKAVAREELSKFTDPFTRANRTFAILWFNNEPVTLQSLDKKLFEVAHAFALAEFEVNGADTRLTGIIEYRLHRREKTFEIHGADLTSVTGVTPEVLRSLGPFSVQFYWFNNRILKEVEGIGKTKQVRDLVQQWAGGLMLFRDGFRIYPYGSFDDDWLKIDPDALSAGGYKVNRRQIIGKVDVSAEFNPELVDQTNREGLRDNPEKQGLVSILRYFLKAQFRAFLNQVEQDRLTNDPADLEEIEDRLQQREQQLKESLNLLLAKYPVLKNESNTITVIQQALTSSRSLIREAREAASSAENRREVTLHLAGLGLMVDIVAHELYRSTRHALDTIDKIDKVELPQRTQNLFSTLASQLTTIQTRLKILDPLSPATRQRKEAFDLKALLEEVISSHEPQFEQEKIRCRVKSQHPEWRIKAVRGMFVQILENLIHNSIYWLNQQKLLQRDFNAEITIDLDEDGKRILFMDNGPGVSRSRAEEVFLPFFTTKPPDAGKGLGLYISREIAQYHGASLYLAEEPRIHDNALNTFVLDLSQLENFR